MEGFDEAKMKQLQLLKEKMKLAKSQKQEEAEKNEENGLNETKKDLNDVKNARTFDTKDARFNKTGSKKFDGFFSNKKIGYPKGSRYPFQQSKSVGFASKKGGVNKPANEVDLFDTPLTFEEVMRRKHERKKLELQKGNGEMESKNDVTNSKQGNALGDKQENADNDNSKNNGDNGNIENGTSGMNSNDQLYKRFTSEHLQNSTFDFSKTNNLNSSGSKDSQYFSLPEFQKNENVTNDNMLKNSVHSLRETNEKQIPLHVESAIQMIDANNTSYIYQEVLMDISSNSNHVLSANGNSINMTGSNLHKNQIAHSFPAPSDSNIDAKSYSLNNSGVQWREDEVIYNATAPSEKISERNEEAKSKIGNGQENSYQKSQTMPQNIINVPKNHDMKINEMHSENKNDIPYANNTSAFMENTVKDKNANHWVPGGMKTVTNVPNMSEPLNNTRAAIATEGTATFDNCMVGSKKSIIGTSAECSNKQDVRFGNVPSGQNIFANASKILETNRTIFGTNIDINNGSGTNSSSLGIANTMMAVKNSTTQLTNLPARTNISNTENYMKNVPSNGFLSNDVFLRNTEHNVAAGVISSTNPQLPFNSVTTFVKKNNMESLFDNRDSNSANANLVTNSLMSKGTQVVGNTISNNNNTWEDMNKSRLQENTLMMEGVNIFKNSSLNIPRNINQNIVVNNENQGIIGLKQSSDTVVYSTQNLVESKLEPIKKGTDLTGILNNNICGTLREDFISTNNAVKGVNMIDKIGTNVTNISTMFTNFTTHCISKTNTNANTVNATTNATTNTTTNATTNATTNTTTSTATNTITNATTNIITNTNATAKVGAVNDIYAPTSLNSNIQLDSKMNQGLLSFNNVHFPGEISTNVENGSVIYPRNTTIDICSGVKGNDSSVYVEETANKNMQQLFKNNMRQDEVNNAFVLNKPTILGENKDILKDQGEQKKTELTEQRKEHGVGYTEAMGSHLLISQGTISNTETDKERNSVTVQNTLYQVNFLKDAPKDYSVLNSGHMINQSINLKNDVNMDKGIIETSVNFAIAHKTVHNPNEKEKVDASTKKDTCIITSLNAVDLEKVKGEVATSQTNTNFNENNVEIYKVQGKEIEADFVTTSNNINIDNEKGKDINNHIELINNNKIFAEKNITTLENNQSSIFTEERVPNSVILKNDIEGSNECKTTTKCIVSFESTKSERNNAIEKEFNKIITDKETQMCLSNENKECIVSVEPVNKEEYVNCKNITHVEQSDKWSSKEQMNLDETEKMNTPMETKEIRLTPEEINDSKEEGERKGEVKEIGNETKKETEKEIGKEIGKAIGNEIEQKKCPTTMETTTEVVTATVEEKLTETVIESMTDVVTNSMTETKLATTKIEEKDKEKENEKENEKKKEEEKTETNNDNFIGPNVGDNIIKDQGDIFQIFQKNGDNMLHLNAEQFGNKEDFDKINQIYKNIGCINKNINYMNKYIPSNIENVHAYINKNTKCMENYDALVKTNKMFLEKIKNENNSEEVNAELTTMINNLNKQMAETAADEKAIKQQPPLVANEEGVQNHSVDLCAREKMEFLNHSANDNVGRNEGDEEGDSSEKMPDHVKRILQRREYFNGARKMQRNENTDENRKNLTKSENDNEQNANCKKMKPYVSLECREMFRNTFYTNNENKNHMFVLDQRIQSNTTQDEQLGIITQDSGDAKVCLTNNTHKDVSKEIKMYTQNEHPFCQMKSELNQNTLEQQKNIVCENQNSVMGVPKDKVYVKPAMYKNTAVVSVTTSVDNIPDNAQEVNVQMEKKKQVEMQNEIKSVTHFVTKLYEQINTNDYINLGKVARKKRKQEDLDDFIDTDGSIEYKMAKLQSENIVDKTNEEEKTNQKTNDDDQQDQKSTQREAQKENEKTNFMNMHNHVMAITNAKTLEDFAVSLTKYTCDSEQILCDIITKNFDLSVKINSLNDLPFLFEELP